MTDRSSEERSRFEEERANFEAWYRDHPGTVSIWHAWQARAALEDRQEAAPKSGMRKLIDAVTDLLHWMPHYSPNSSGYSRRSAVPTYFVTHPYGSYSIADPAAPAPAPEVQGTPRSLGKLIHDATIQKGEEFAVTGEELDTICAATPGPHPAGTMVFCGKNLRVESPVGTPQKETPPVFIKRYTTEEARAAGLPVADGAVEILLYGSSVGAPPEEVQGKEPRDWKRVIEEACVVNHINFYPDDAVKSLSNLITWEVKVALDPKVSKEAAELMAAGRRSAITENEREKSALQMLRELAEAKPDMKLVSAAGVILGSLRQLTAEDIARGQEIANKLELQEKTKP